MRRKMRIEVEPELDGIGFHVVVIDLDGNRLRVKGWQHSRLSSWRTGLLYRRRLESGTRVKRGGR